MSTGPALYEILTGHLGDGTPIETYDNRTLTFLSVMDSLRRILNTRAGSLKHMPDYGLPDLSNIYRHLPNSAYDLLSKMKSTLLKYEPRLNSLEIELMPNDDGLALKYMLTCHLHKSGLVRFGTYFEPAGVVGIGLWQY